MTLYSGTPGSGKSLSMCKEVVYWLKKYRKNVIANTRINRNAILRGKSGGRFYYFDNDQLTPDLLYRYAIKFHELGREHQTLLIFDEAQVKFSPTAVKLFTQEDKNYRQDWLEFFTQHRHLGFDIIIVSQFDKLIDPQVRCLFEYNYVHRKANNFGAIGKLFNIFGISLFVQVCMWYGCREKCGSVFFTYSKKYASYYDSYSYRSQIIAKLTAKYGEEQMQLLMGFKRPKKKSVVKDEALHQEESTDEKKALSEEKTS